MNVTQIGRLQWYVTSESRPGLVHLVDFEPTEYERFVPLDNVTGTFEQVTVVEPTFCSCEAFNMLQHRPCKHQREVITELVNSIALTGEQRENMTARLEQLCRESPHWINREPEEDTEEQPAPTSIQTKRVYNLPPNT